jgi:hypothetical protein
VTSRPPANGDAAERIAGADWDLPLTDHLLTSVSDGVRRRRSRQRWRIGLAAAAVVLVAAVGAGAVLRSGADRLDTGGTKVAAPRSSATGVVDGWAITVPGFAPDGPASFFNTGRFGPRGLFNDDKPKAADEVPVDVRGRQFASGQSKKIWLFVFTPRPDAASGHTSADVSTQIVASKVAEGRRLYAAVEPIPGVPAGSATLLTSNATNFVVWIAATDGKVVELETVGVSKQVAMAAARSLRLA